MNNYPMKMHLFMWSVLAGVALSAPSHAHQGSSTAEPRLVCAEKKLGAACEWKDGHDALYIGSCRQVSTSLLCVRNKPIVYPEKAVNEKAHVHTEEKTHTHNED